MDFQPEPDMYNAPYPNKRSEHMASAAVILGIAALLTSGCIYTALICGALGILFALLSKGGELTMSSQAKVGLTLSAVGLIATLVIYTLAVLFVMHYYGGFDGLMKEYQNFYNTDSLEQFYQSIGNKTI